MCRLYGQFNIAGSIFVPFYVRPIRLDFFLYAWFGVGERVRTMHNMKRVILVPALGRVFSEYATSCKTEASILSPVDALRGYTSKSAFLTGYNTPPARRPADGKGKSAISSQLAIHCLPNRLPIHVRTLIVTGRRSLRELPACPSRPCPNALDECSIKIL